ncbi:valyl-tRNA synthetase [Altererythrobacter atlanticus]|nr:valine--tRNA ligase [Croceibacterium atlanticum]MBB5731254.1 valyl-tRNA synthetase [Croceibacterium atlanticum]
MTSELSKTFDPAAIEAKWYKHWEESGAFRPERPDAEPFTIVNPPPNVTGSLHIGHALDNTLQDIVIRYERLRGKDALWVVGTDHAGIATQMVVERQLEQAQDKRTNYTREQFVEKVWEWKHESGGTITRQLRRLGCSMDWSREQFTMDEHFTRAVLKVFVDLHNEGLIYRDKRLVNWDPKLKTAISDLEVETREIQGGFWHFKYPLADGVTLDDGRDYIEVATTRPETMLADMAVAVHPDDERYKSVIGKEILQPITGRRFRVVADEHADPELGSGAVKITPGHDFNDFEVGKRAGIQPAEMLNMLDADAAVCQCADGLIPDEFIGLDRFDARKLVVQRMKQLGFLIPHVTKDKEGNEIEHDAEPRTIATPYGDRGGVVIEPWLTDQWYVDAKTLAGPAMDAVRSGAIEIVPKSWEKTFFNWMENIQPWCVSRQLWWGHRIPAWYDEDGNVFVAETEEEALALAQARHAGGNDDIRLTRDEDVLDTWFSSALWPFATLGWPDDTDLVKKHYPNSLLVSGFDILFFWDARMMMQGIHFMKEVPWPKLYLHGLVRAADGQKMSKSKGNVVDPLGLIDKYGADALRFFMSAMETQGRDLKMDESRVEGYRNFATKLWNATRFCQANGIGASTALAAPAATLPVNKWIIGEVVETLAALDKAMADLRFDAAANTIYQFVWATFCDWYLELIKGNIDEETRAVAGWALDQILVMLHPFMPFITEELWHGQAEFHGGKRPYDLILAKWPEPGATVDAEARIELEWLIEFIEEIRKARSMVNLPPSAKVDLWLLALERSRFAEKQRPKDNYWDLLSKHKKAIARMAGVNNHFTPSMAHAFDLRTGITSEIEANGNVVPPGATMCLADPSVNILANGNAYRMPVGDLVDLEAERARLTKAKDASAKERDSLAKRLENPNFVERAKPEAVEKARADHAHHAAEVERLDAALKRLG